LVIRRQFSDIPGQNIYNSMIFIVKTKKLNYQRGSPKKFKKMMALIWKRLLFFLKATTIRLGSCQGFSFKAVAAK